MARIYRTSDRIPVKIDDITVVIAPLSFAQKTELQSIMLQAKDDPLFAVRGARLAIKYAVKDVKGVEDMTGADYVPFMDGEGNLSDDDVDALLNLEENGKIITLCSQLIGGVPRGVVDPTTGKPMKGVSIVLPEPGKKSKARA
jgi:hypothetical protein